jgi:hypothetical protein
LKAARRDSIGGDRRSDDVAEEEILVAIMRKPGAALAAAEVAAWCSEQLAR